MSSAIVVWAGSKGVHSDEVMLHVIETLEKLYLKSPDKADVLVTLRGLVEWAQGGGVNNEVWRKANEGWLRMRGFIK